MTFEKGKPVFVLESPDGTSWIMQAYSDIVDLNLTYDHLKTLDTKLKLAPGCLSTSNRKVAALG